jgi:hypothetical protein
MIARSEDGDINRMYKKAVYMFVEIVSLFLAGVWVGILHSSTVGCLWRSVLSMFQRIDLGLEFSVN